MNRYCAVAVIVLLFAFAACAEAQLTCPMLSDDQVSTAIERAWGKQHDIGLTIGPPPCTNCGAIGFQGRGMCSPCLPFGHTIKVFDAESWIEYQARRNKVMPTLFGVADVPTEMKMPYLHVVASPSFLGGRLAGAVRNVVLMSTDKSETVQPLSTKHVLETIKGTFDSVSYTSTAAIFAVNDVERVRQRDKKGEFLIVVGGDKSNVPFKIKSTFFKQIFGTSEYEPSPFCFMPPLSPRLPKTELDRTKLDELKNNSGTANSHPAQAAALAFTSSMVGSQEFAAEVKAGRASKTTVSTTPSGAEVFIDGKKAGVTPLLVGLMKTDAPRLITIKLAGYRTIEMAHEPDGMNISIAETLEKEENVN